MLFHRANLTSLILLSAAIPTLGNATDSFTHFPEILGGDSIERMQGVYQMVQQDPVVQAMLGEDTHANALAIADKVSSYGVETTKFQHFYKGVEVMGSMTFHHDSPAGTEVHNVLSRFDLDVRPTLSAEAAVAIAKSVAGDRELTQAPKLKILPSKTDDSARLIYWVDLETVGFDAGSDVLIDAHSGKLIAHLSKMETLAPIQVVSAQKQGLQIMPVAKKNEKTGQYELAGCQVTDLAKNSDLFVTVEVCKAVIRGQTDMTKNQCQMILMDSETSGSPLGIAPSSCLQVVVNGVASLEADQTAKNALDNTTKVLSYYKTTHGRDSFDNAGTEVVSAVHVGKEYGNAAWIQGLDVMMYGDGDGVKMGDMTLALDVAGHEMTHGITSKTAKLTMMDEAGALNEGYADFFGKMIAQDGTWMMAESLSVDRVSFPGLRNLADPHSLSSTHLNGAGEKVTHPYPAKVSEQEKKNADTVCGKTNDRCWVHYNSTIPSHAAYLVHQAIGKAKAETLYYLTLTSYLTSEATFKTAAVATMKACAAKFDAATCSKVKAAFVEVGMLK